MTFITPFKKALVKIRQGNFVLIHDADDREDETDFILAAEFVNPSHIRTMRQDGGGLIFLMISDEIAKRFQLPFIVEVFTEAESRYHVLKTLFADDIPYDTKSSFSLWINHRDTFTGITDNDRSLTMNEFALLSKKVLENKELIGVDELGKFFRSPGHVPICRASDKPLSNRYGHTELSIALLTMAGVTPVASGCEIMGDDGLALSKNAVKRYADKHHLIFLDGKDIIEEWESWSP
ncbi:MAG: 3,4-dihydroxy-2-butanone-4-phosphate synthase [Candidatus Thermoplasmatota archaeon]|nr:3,4-dihydroxy-2-butanone-4-phosphate synthase [Candidatus Thermoplasmatota archaeon]